MQATTFAYPVIYAVFLWWFTTGVIIAVYRRSSNVMQLSFIGFTVALMVALFGVYFTRELRGPLDIYVAVTCGVVIWGWQTASYYMGFVTGPGKPEESVGPHGWENSLIDRLKLALRFTIYHELVVIGIGLVLAGLTYSYTNHWGFWIYMTLWLMHFSAKANVFLGVRNFSVEHLPHRMRYLDRLLTKRTNNALFPVSIILATSIGLMLLYRGVAPTTPPAQSAGYLFVGTMIALGVIEHWMLVLPLPSMLVGFQMQPVTAMQPLTTAGVVVPTILTTATAPTPLTSADIPSTRRIKRTYTFERKHGPFVVDVWDAREPLDKTPVMLVHGWGNSGSYWRDTAFDLSKTVKVIVPDLPGTGRSMPIYRAHNFYDQVDSLVWLLDELELDKVQLAGHSMGGAMSVVLAAAHPARVERLHLTSIAFFMTEGQKRFFTSVMNVYRLTMGFRPDWLASVPYVPQLIATQYFYRIPQDEELLQSGLRDYLSLDAATAIASARDVTDPAITAAGAKISVPTLLVACRQDRAMAIENVDFTARTIPGCEVHWIEECGHLPMVEKPDEFMSILTDFLDV